MSPQGVVLALSLLPIVSAKRLHSFAGPYVAYADKWIPCDPRDYDHSIEMYFRTTHFNPRSPNVLQKLSGNVTTLVDFSDKNAILVHLDSWSNNQWKENAFVFKFPKDGCTVLKGNIPDVFRVLFSNNLRCPVEKGIHTFDNEPVNWTFPNFPVMPYGHWRFKMTILDGRRTIGCMTVECLTIPRL